MPNRDLKELKARLQTKVDRPTSQDPWAWVRELSEQRKAVEGLPFEYRIGDRQARQVGELLGRTEKLQQFIRDLYQSSISTEDAGEFTLGTQEVLQALIESWGETVMSAQEYMEAQEAACEKAKDAREFERLRQKLGK